MGAPTELREQPKAHRRRINSEVAVALLRAASANLHAIFTFSACRASRPKEEEALQRRSTSSRFGLSEAS
jgi:hypothetical protein